MSRITFDARTLSLYPVGKPGFTGATEMVVRVLARGLAERGHTVHVVTPDLEDDEQRGPTEFWWGLRAFPTACDVLVPVPHLLNVGDFRFEALVPFNNGPDYVGEEELIPAVSAWPVFSECHARLLCAAHPTINAATCVLTGLGVDLDEYTFVAPGPMVPGNFQPPDIRDKVPGRIWVGNDPARGLWHVLDVFEIVQKEYPEASLHVSYDFARRFERTKWQHRALAEMLWDCDRRLRTLPNVANLGALTREEVVREQLEAMVHLWPSDPPNVGTQIHGISQMEAAAAGCALVLSDVEAFPEVFGSAAEILPTIGTYEPAAERRCDAQDYAEVVLEILRNPQIFAEKSQKSRLLAEQHTWGAVVDRWDELVRQLVGGREAVAA